MKRVIRLEIAAIETEKSRYVRVGIRQILALRHRGGVAGCRFGADPRIRADERAHDGPMYGRPARNCACADCARAWIRLGPPSCTPRHWRLRPTPAPAPAPPFAQSVPAVPAGHVALAVAARYGRDAPLISGGLIWRVYAANPDLSGMFRLVKEDRTATPTFMLPPGDYVVHASFGLASAAKAVQLRADTVARDF